MRKILILLLAFIGISACDLANETLNSQAEKVKISLSTEIGKCDATKVAFDNLAFSWTTGDILNVYGYNTASGKEYDENAIFTLDPSDAGKKGGSFTGEFSPEPTVGSNIYAAYGSVGSVDKSSGFTADFTQPHIQVQYHKADGEILPNAIGDYTYMYGKSTTTYNSSMGANFPITMKNVMSVIDFNISGFPTSRKIEKLTFSLDSPLLGSVNVNFDSGTITNGSASAPTNVSVELKDASNNLGVSVGDLGAMTVRMAILPQSIAANTSYTLIIETDDLAYINNRTFLSTKVLGSGVRYTLDVDFSDMASLNSDFANKQVLGYYSDLEGSLVEEYLYSAGTHQVSVLEKADNVRFSLSSCDGTKFMRVSSIPKTIALYQTYSIPVQSLGLGLTDEAISMKVLKIEEGKAWLATADNSIGFIVNIPE